MVGFGGINPAGRMSFNHAYRRLVIDALDQDRQASTYRSLAQLMGRSEVESLSDEDRAHIRDHTLIRRIELFDPDSVTWQSAAKLAGGTGQQLKFTLASRQLPEPLPDNWQITPVDERKVEVTIDSLSVMIPQ